MKTSIRISISYVIGSIISKTAHAFILADAENQYLKISGKFTSSTIDAVENETGNTYYGMIMGDQGTFTHTSENASITFKLDGNKFTGMESQSGKSFNGSVSNNIIKIFDYDEGKYFSYHLM